MRPGRVLLGLGLVALGVLFLLDQANVLDAGDIIGDWWPVAIIAFGLAQFAEQPRSPVGPVIVVGVGVVLLLTQLDVVDVSIWALVWPVVLIVVGLAILLRRDRARAPRGTGDDVVRSFALFGGNDLVSRSERFRGGSLTAIFGGVELDLRQARLDPGGAALSVTAIFGGVDVLVPRGWRVQMGGLPIFGGYDDTTRTDPVPPADAPTLKVDVTAIFGGADVKHEK